MVIAEDLFRAALHLTAPWYISSINFAECERKLDIWVDFPKGSRFSCPEGNNLDCEVHDTTTRTWCHLDFFVISYFENRYSNGLLEGLNSMIQSLKANTRGY